MSYYNPLREIIENHTFVLSRFHRTNYIQKLKDSFFVFSGSFFESNKKHIGLFDYATLMIPYGLTTLTLWSLINFKKNYLAAAALLPLALITCSFSVIRYSIAAILTCTISPFLFLSHCISKFSGDKFKEKILQIPVIVCDKKLKNSLYCDNTSEEKSSLGEYLKTRNCDLEDLEVECFGTYKKLNVSFNKKELSLSKENDLIAHTEFVFGEEGKNDSENFKTLAQLNLGGIARKIEKQTSLFDFFTPLKDKATLNWISITLRR